MGFVAHMGPNQGHPVGSNVEDLEETAQRITSENSSSCWRKEIGAELLGVWLERLFTQ